MTDTAVDVHSGPDDTLVIHPRGALGADAAARLRRLLVQAVRHTRPSRLILDLRDVSHLDPINLGALAAACDLGDDHEVEVSLEHNSPALADQLCAVGVERARLHHRA
ncbi:STAS domain-containing protein [Actinoplanes sp. NPDC049265]|uniref:STAS domain-containing protein n=1 Tax=Actinoplanes sp. NPDC049265 TaxID=3363902 RepID=UPI0037195E91